MKLETIRKAVAALEEAEQALYEARQIYDKYPTPTEGPYKITDRAFEDTGDHAEMMRRLLRVEEEKALAATR